MTSSHQSLQNYTGSLQGDVRYSGIEYDYEVPDNLVVSSPGGVSSIHHHYTKGFYGRGDASADIYGGQGQRYNSGIYGNLYNSGQTAPQHMGYYSSAPDYQFWQNEQPQQYSVPQGQSGNIPGGPTSFGGGGSLWAPAMQLYGQSKKSPTNEYYLGEEDDYETFEYDQNQTEGDIEFLEPSDDEDSDFDDLRQNVSDIREEQTSLVENLDIPPWALFLFFLFAFVAFSFWAETGSLFISQTFHDGERPTWKHMLLYAIIITVIFTVIIYFAGIPLTTFERL